MECGERSDCVQLKDPEVLKDLYELQKCLTRTMLCSQKQFLSKLPAAGLSGDDILLQRCAKFSLEDTLTDAMGKPVPFEHKFICGRSDDGEVRTSIISGHAHSGMLTAADSIEQICTPKLLRALRDYPDFKIKIVGHSLGGGTAALLTYRLRETLQFSSCTCVTFGPGMHASVQIKHKKLLNAALNVVSDARAVAHQAVTSGVKRLKKRRQNIRSLLHWSHQENEESVDINLTESSGSTDTSYEEATKSIISKPTSDEDEFNFSCDESDYDDDISEDKHVIFGEELLKQLEKLALENQDVILNVSVKEEQEVTTKEIAKDEDHVVHNEDSVGATTFDNLDKHPLYPLGRTMHIVPSSSFGNSNSNYNNLDEKHLYLYETPKRLYEKLRLSERMILDHMTKKYKKMLHQLIKQLEKN
ncbi:hypothetical protein Fmac_002872 [Flemingia macrophylla]|uniref:Fungal lipase-type domain-containing protein n=1 Tax=Flemingia macrophylla TaxID=520843 RepID=A0ABD1NMJ8_9FABA